MPRKTDRAGVVADNLKRAIGETPINAWAVAHTLHQPTIRRIVIGETSPTEKMIGLIAASMGIEPWQLLVPGMTVRNAPVLREATDVEKQLYQRIDETIAELGKLRELANTQPGSLR